VDVTGLGRSFFADPALIDAGQGNDSLIVNL